MHWEGPLSGAGSHAGSAIAFSLPPNPRVPGGQDKVVLEEVHRLPLGILINELKCRNASQLVFPGHFLLKTPFKTSLPDPYASKSILYTKMSKWTIATKNRQRQELTYNIFKLGGWQSYI